MPQTDKKTCRPRDHLIAAGKLYPEAWKRNEYFRAGRGINGLPDWPNWCYLPIAASYAIVSEATGYQQIPMSRMELIGDVARLASLSAWRLTQGIYRFDPAVFEAVRDTPVTGDLPCDVLYRLPEWCIYVETPGMMWDKADLFGVFVHLEWDTNSKTSELRLLLDTEDALVPVPLHMGPWSLLESITRMTDVAAKHAAAAHIDLENGAEPINSMRRQVEPIISLLLYLCAQASEIGDDKARPGNPVPKKIKGGFRMFAADKPTTWDVGVRMGAALRRAYHAEETGQGGDHAGPRAHIRRSHWHGFRSGPMKREDGTEIPTESRKFDLRWMPPIPVNFEGYDDLPATIRKINKRLQKS